MRPQAPIDTEGMTKRIDANSKIQMGIIKDKVEAAAGKGEPGAAAGEDGTGAAAEPTT
jgi:aromatase